jgi:uncharacterized protein YqfA (UPF0365 family)
LASALTLSLSIPLKALYWSAVVNGVLAPPVMVLLMLLVLVCNVRFAPVTMLISSLTAALGRGLIGNLGRVCRWLVPRRKPSRFITLIRRKLLAEAVELHGGFGNTPDSFL